MLATPRIKNSPLRTKYGKFIIHVFSWSDNEQDNVLVVMPEGKLPEAPLIRVQSACYTGEIFGSLDCDCHWQLENSLKAIQKHGGAFIYMLKDGRGAGLLVKIHGMRLSHDLQIDTADAYAELKIPLDPRKYDEVIYILKHFGMRSVRLLTNNPRKIKALADAGFNVDRIPLESEPTDENRPYLRAKAVKLGHLMRSFGTNP